MRRGAYIFPLWKIPPIYALAVETTMCLSILIYMWIVPFAGGGSFVYFVGLVSSGLQYGCMSLVWLGMMHHFQCEVPYH